MWGGRWWDGRQDSVRIIVVRKCGWSVHNQVAEEEMVKITSRPGSQERAAAGQNGPEQARTGQRKARGGQRPKEQAK